VSGLGSTYNAGPNTTTIPIDTTVPVPPNFWLTSIIATATPHGIAYVFDTDKELILDSNSVNNSFLVQGNQLEKFFEGVFIKVDNSYLSKNNGSYIVHASFAEGLNTRVYVKQMVPASKPLANPFDGRMYLHIEGYDEPAYCRLLQAPDLHADTFIHEHIRFEIVTSPRDEITGMQVLENEPRGYGVSPYGDSYGTGQNGHPYTAPTTGITLLPTGFDGQAFNMGGFDETVQTVRHFYGLTV